MNIDISNKNNTQKKIKSFFNLSPGWNYGEGKEIDFDIISLAVNLHNTILYYGFTETDAFPGLDGEIRITIYHKDYYFEFTINENQTVDYCKELKDDSIETREGISIADTYSIISILEREFCEDLSELSILNTMIKNDKDLQVSLFGVEKEYLSLNENVQSLQVMEFVTISESFTPQLQVTL